MHKNGGKNRVTVIINLHHLFLYEIGIIRSILVINSNRIMTFFISLLIRATFELEMRDNELYAIY
jgi:hypothetical protein